MLDDMMADDQQAVGEARTRMAGEPASDYLRMACQWSIPDQRAYEDAIIDALTEFWASRPPEDEFVSTLKHMAMNGHTFFRCMSAVSSAQGGMILG